MTFCTELVYSGLEDPRIIDVQECRNHSNGDGSFSITDEFFVDVTPYKTVSEILFLVIGVITIAIIASLLAYFFRNRHTKIMMTSGTFAAGTLFGFFFLLLGLLMWPLESSIPLCYVKPWFLALGFGLVGGALLSKVFHLYHFFALSNDPTQPLHKLRHYQTPEKAHERDQRLKFFFAGIIVLELTLIVVMMSVQETRPEIKYECCQTNEQIYTVCTFSDFFGWAAFIINLIPFVLGCFYVARVHMVSHRVNQSVQSLESEVKSAQSTFTEGPSAAKQIKIALDRQLKLFRPVEYMVLCVVFCGIILTVVGYTGIPVETSSGRLAYYCLRAIMFILVVYFSFLLIFRPIMLQIREETSPKLVESASSVPANENKLHCPRPNEDLAEPGKDSPHSPSFTAIAVV